MTGIFSEVETEMGQEREHREEGEERQSPHLPLSQRAGSTGHSQQSEGLPGLPTEAVGQDQQLHWSHSLWGYGQHPKAPWIAQGQHGLGGPPPAGAPGRPVAWLCLTGEAGSGGGENKRKWLLTRPFQAHLVVLG